MPSVQIKDVPEETRHILRRRPAGQLDARRAQLARDDLLDLTIYDAAYVALAEALGSPLLTAGTRLARAPGLRCTVEVLSPRGETG